MGPTASCERSSDRRVCVGVPVITCLIIPVILVSLLGPGNAMAKEDVIVPAGPFHTSMDSEIPFIARVERIRRILFGCVINRYDQYQRRLECTWYCNATSIWIIKLRRDS